MTVQKHMFSYLTTSLEELDVKTYMTENKAAKRIARLGYHTIKGLVISVQIIALTAFKGFKNFSKLGSRLKFLGKKSCILFISSPRIIKQKFWPSQAEKFDKQLNYFKNHLLQVKQPTLATLIGEGEKELSHNEKKELMRGWMTDYLKSSLNQSHIADFFNLMNQIVNGDIPSSSLEKIEKQVIEISKEKDIKNNFPLLFRATSTFITIFKEEKIKEAHLGVEICRNNPLLILKYPNLLKRKDIRDLINTLKEPLKSKIVAKKSEILTRQLKSIHQIESKKLSNLPYLLKRFSQEELSENYISIAEQNYLLAHLNTIRQYIQQLQNSQGKTAKSFELRILELEETYLVKQQEQMKEAKNVFEDFEDNGIFKQVHMILDEEITLIRKSISTRIENSLIKINNLEANNLYAQFEQLSNALDKNYFNEIPGLIKQLYQLEQTVISSLPNSEIEVFLNNPHVNNFLSVYEKIDTLYKESSPWKDLKELKTVKERRQESEENLAKDVICLVLEKNTHCQLPLLLANKASRSLDNPNPFDNSEVQSKLQQAALEFVTSVQNTYLESIKQELSSFHEFAEHIKKGRELPIVDQAQQAVAKTSPNFELLASDLNINDPLNDWHRSLQKIWTEHLPREQEEAILAISKKTDQKKKMNECFLTWLGTVTGTKITLSLSFEEITIEDHSNERNATFSKLEHQQKFKSGLEKFTKKIQKTLHQKTSKNSKSSKAGFHFDLIGHETPNELPFFKKLVLPEFVEIAEHNLQQLIDPIKALVKAKQAIDTTGSQLNQRIQWVKCLIEDPQLKSLRDLKLHILAECRAIANESFETNVKVSNELQNLFLSLYYKEDALSKKRELDFEDFSNLQRIDFLNIYLKMTFAGNDQAHLTATQRAYLMQFLVLSSLEVETIEKVKGTISVVNNSNSSTFDSLDKVGKILQASFISLEGVEDEIIQKTFQQAFIAQDFNTRQWIDALRASGTEKLAFFLYDYVRDFHKIDHDQGREAIERHIRNIIKQGAPKEILQNAISFLDLTGREFNEKILAPSLEVFYKDLQLELDFIAIDDAVIIAFNQQLIVSGEFNKMLMGYAREISRLSKDLSNPFQVYSLLKCKIAYQHLKFNYFDGKKKIAGFLKIETDKADAAMTSTALAMQDKLADIDFVAELSKIFNTPINNPSYADKIISQEWKKSNSQELKPGVLKGWINLGERLTIDGVLGVIYNEGQQQVSLPAHLQNHPALRSLGVHGLPYVWNAQDNSFIYYKKENEIRVPQVIIKELNGQPIIQKRLSVEFTFSGKKTENLQFISKEETNLPDSVLQHMKIKHFWQDPSHNLYGYDSDGNLAAIITYQNDPTQRTVQIKNERYRFFQADHQNPELVLARLLKTFYSDEILENLEKNSFFIPSIGLKLTKSQEKSQPTPTWICEQEGMARKIIDTSHSSPYLFLKNEGSEQKSAVICKKLKEISYRLQLEQLKDASHINRHTTEQFKQQITHLETELTAVEECVFISRLPSKNSEKDKIQEIFNTIPYSFQIVAKDYEALSYKAIIPKILIDLKEKLVAKLAVATAQDASLQQEIVDLLQAYQKIQAKYNQIGEDSNQVVFFKENNIKFFSSIDLAGALVLTLNQLKQNTEDLEQVSYIPFIQELAKYPLDQPLTETCLKLLDNAIDCVDQQIQKNEGMIQLQFYLHLMKFLHFSYKMQELAHTPLSDKQNKVDATEHAYLAIKIDCQKTMEQLNEKIDKSVLLTKELRTLWYKSGFNPENLLLQEGIYAPVNSVKITKPVVEKKIQMYASQTLLERLFISDAVVAEAKDPKQELSKQQLALTKAFITHSPDQVAGFYLEEMGRFNLKELYAEFKISKEAPQGLFGLTKENINEIWRFLEKYNYIEKEMGGYYSLKSVDKALELFNPNEISALFANKSLSNEQIQKITNRLEAFLFKTMQSGFKFSFKEGKESEIDRKIDKEKEIHLHQFLEAEAILQTELKIAEISLTDLKYAWLSGDFGILGEEKINRLSNAMTRYLFHKTEVQHIDNIQKAPLFGERNKIELLQTKRNYPVHHLFQEGLIGDARREKIVQRAFLSFEENYGYRCNSMQIRMFNSLLLDTPNEESIDAAQARMGFGKTALLPLMAIVRIAFEKNMNQKHLVRYVVPKAVIEDNTSSFNQRLSSILGSHAIKDYNFDRYQIDKKEPKHSFELVKKDLEFRLSFYLEAIKRGDVLIQWPEIRGSMEAQELDFGKMITENEFENETLDLCIECKRLLGKIRSISTYTIFDELDDTQDIKSREVNFTTGRKISIPSSTIRPLEKILSYINENKGENWSALEERAEDMVKALCTDVNGLPLKQCPIGIKKYLTDRSVDINKDVKAILSPSLSNYINNKTGTDKHTENDSMLFLIRTLLLDENMLALAKNKQPNTHFGVRFIEREGQRVYFADPESQAPLLIAVPYEGTNTPKGLSIFDNTEVAAITTMRYYLSKETPFSIKPHLDFLIAQIKYERIPEDLIKHYLKNLKGKQGCFAFDKLKEICGMLDAEELKIAKEDFYNEFLQNPSDGFRKFFAMAVVATQIRSDEASAKSDRYEKGSVDNIEKGCSGTVGGTSSYFLKQETDPAADGKLSIEIMGRDNNASVIGLKSPTPDLDYLNQIIADLLQNANVNTRAIIDAAGICKSRDGTPETVVAELWRQIKNEEKFLGIEGIVFYGRDNIKRLYRGPNSLTIPCNTTMELAALKDKKYFSFYGQKNTRGSDIKQANGAHALVTLDENVTNSDVKQAVLRFRNLVNRDSKQIFSFAITPSMEGAIKQTLKMDAVKRQTEASKELQSNQQNLEFVQAKKIQIEKLKHIIANIDEMKIEGESSKKIEAKDIANFLRIQEKNIEEKNALTIFRKEMKAHVQQAATHLEHDILRQLPPELTDKQKEAYLVYLRERQTISSFVQRSTETLYLKYGLSTQVVDRDTFIQQEKEVARRKLNQLFVAADKFAVTVNHLITLKTEFYDDQLKRSEKIFMNRFAKSTPIQINKIDVEAQAVAQAVAEALAQAEAEGLAEKLAESEIQVLERIVLPKLAMAKSYTDVNLDFLRDDTLRQSISKHLFMQHLIRSDLHNRFEFSPMLMKPLVSAFFLTKKDKPFVFISQQEADLILKSPEELLNGYCLSDARNLRVNLKNTELSEEIKQIFCAILDDNGIPKEYISNTANLRTTSLTNVKSTQLLPQIKITSQVRDGDNLGDYFNLGNFGVIKKTDFSIEVLKPLAEELSITIQSEGKDFSIKIEKNNKYLNKFIPKAFLSNKPCKFKEVQRLVNQEYEKYRLKIAALQGEIALIEELKQEGKEEIKKVGDFQVTFTMSDGLLQRDRELSNTYGTEFISALIEINQAQSDFKMNSTLDQLEKLRDSFNNFVSIKLIRNTNILDINTTLLVTRDQWNEVNEDNYKDKLKPFERVYGRILHRVHGGDIDRARICQRQDCHCMFVETLPALIKTIQSIDKTITKISELEKQAQEIQKKIDAVSGPIKLLITARETVEKILDQQKTIESHLKSSGIRFAEQQFFDQFRLENFKDWNVEILLQAKVKMPAYKHVIKKGMQKHQEVIKALNRQESDVLKRNKNFYENVLTLSGEVTNRMTETVIK
jgi:hypothetical protein